MTEYPEGKPFDNLTAEDIKQYHKYMDQFRPKKLTLLRSRIHIGIRNTTWESFCNQHAMRSADPIKSYEAIQVTNATYFRAYDQVYQTFATRILGYLQDKKLLIYRLYTTIDSIIDPENPEQLEWLKKEIKSSGLSIGRKGGQDICYNRGWRLSFWEWIYLPTIVLNIYNIVLGSITEEWYAVAGSILIIGFISYLLWKSQRLILMNDMYRTLPPILPRL